MRRFWLAALLLAPALLLQLGCDMGSPSPPGPVDPNITVSCKSQGQRCSSSGDCCGTLTCDNRVCSGGSCKGAGSRCSSSSECCGTSTCDGGICSSPTGACTDRGGACHSSSDCCGVLTCGSRGRCE